MPIAIQEISVQDLGPVKEFQMQLGPFNLIYGPNERGKTFLVEFILKSLFKSAGKWRLRDEPAAGRVTVTGLGDEPVSFTPSSREKKLEDFWENWRDGLPADMARLLVVKGAELSWMDDRPGRIDKAVIQGYLSRTGVVDSIQKGISPTLQGASIEEGIISGNQRGEIKKRNDARRGLEGIDSLFTEIDQVYSGGTRASLDSEQAVVAEEIEGLERAKRHVAWRHDAEAQSLEQELAVLSEENVGSLDRDHRDHQRVSRRIRHMEDQRLQLQGCRDDYEWLDAAIAMTERLGEQTAKRVRPTFLILSILALAASIVIALIGEPYLSGVFTLAGLAAGGVYVWLLTKFATQAADAEELRRIFEEYEGRFGRRLTNLAAMQAHRLKLQPDYYRSDSLEGEIERARAEQRDLESAIQESFRVLGSGAVAQPEWEGAVDQLVQRRDLLVKRLQREREDLARLDVDVSDYIRDDPGIEYSKAKLEERREALSRITEALREDEAERTALKQSICRETKDVISVPWSELIANLRTTRDEVADGYRSVTSEILAKIVVHRELERIREGQDAMVRERLGKESVTSPLRGITGRYDRVDLEGNHLVVSDAFQEFRLADLSTGAQEQVLLALRIGFASTIMGDERAFLILDDAFQHADWERRVRLMDQMVGLADQGWQILYFSMDDHIRGLFDEVGQARFGERYCRAELTQA